MTNTIELKYSNGEIVTTRVNSEATTREVKDYYSDMNFLNYADKQVKEIKFFKGFKDMFAGEREHVSVARYDENAESYLF